MRTPLQSLIMLARQLLNLILSPTYSQEDRARACKYCKIFVSQLMFVEAFAEDMLNLYVINEKVFKLEAELFDPQEVIGFVKDMFEEKAKSKGVAIEIRSVKFLSMPNEQGGEGRDKTNQAMPKRLIGDERRIKQVLINLIKNAYKFTPSGGSIFVTLAYRKDQASLVIHIKDTGVGIAP